MPSEINVAPVKISTSGMKPKISIVGNMKDRVLASAVEKALGASESTPLPFGDDTPLGFVAVRQELFSALRSTGGRPGFSDTERRKIPVTEPVWRVVSEAAERMSAPGFRPSAAQVASAILTIAVRHMAPETLQGAEDALKATLTLDLAGNCLSLMRRVD